MFTVGVLRLTKITMPYLSLSDHLFQDASITLKNDDYDDFWFWWKMIFLNFFPLNFYLFILFSFDLVAGTGFCIF